MTDPKPICPNCGYELSGILDASDTVTCPECGESVTPRYRKTQSLRYALNFAVGLIGIPSVVVPTIALVLIQLLDYQFVMRHTRTYHRAAFFAPFVWIPIAFWLTIRYKHTPEAQRDIGATIAILLGVTFVSGMLYYVLLLFTALLTSGF